MQSCEPRAAGRELVVLPGVHSQRAIRVLLLETVVRKARERTSARTFRRASTRATAGPSSGRVACSGRPFAQDVSALVKHFPEAPDGVPVTSQKCSESVWN
jgi:hypothetical protein